MEEISPEVRQRILDQHNLLRNQHAKGETEGYPTANRMATMVSFVKFCKNSKH